MPDSAHIAAVVPEIIAEVLDLDAAQRPARGRFYADLQGESIELLGVRVDFGKLIDVEAAQAETQGRVSPAALAQLKARYPFLATETLPPQPTFEDLKNLLTVDAITAFVQWSAEQTVREAAPERPEPAPPDPARATAPA